MTNSNSRSVVKIGILMSLQQRRQGYMHRMREAILVGDWAEVEQLCSKEAFRHDKDFLYSVYTQIYLEYIERQEFQKALTYLLKKLKPLESRQRHPHEFKDLC